MINRFRFACSLIGFTTGIILSKTMTAWARHDLFTLLSIATYVVIAFALALVVSYEVKR